MHPTWCRLSFPRARPTHILYDVYRDPTRVTNTTLLELVDPTVRITLVAVLEPSPNNRHTSKPRQALTWRGPPFAEDVAFRAFIGGQLRSPLWQPQRQKPWSRFINCLSVGAGPESRLPRPVGGDRCDKGVPRSVSPTSHCNRTTRIVTTTVRPPSLLICPGRAGDPPVAGQLTRRGA